MNSSKLLSLAKINRPFLTSNPSARIATAVAFTAQFSTFARMDASGKDSNNGASNSDSNSSSNNDPIVQYIVVRTDLEWGTGALIAQACHASVATIAQSNDSYSTKSYLADLANMHKIILKADKVEDLRKLESKLKEAKVDHHLWIEQPENIPTCLACSPQRKSLVQAIFKHFKLFR